MIWLCSDRVSCKVRGWDGLDEKGMGITMQHLQIDESCITYF